MKSFRRIWLLGAAVAAAATASPAAAQSVEAGVRAWQAQNYEEALRQWRPLAERGDMHAQFNLGHAYRLGRGVAADMRAAEHWYERAARAGHPEAQAIYGVMLFQNGRRREAIPWLEQGARAGDPRAQYIYGTALFNGDLTARDWPRAYALMRLAADQGLPPAVSQLRSMEEHLSHADREAGMQLAQQIRAGAPTATRPEQQPPQLAQATPRPAPPVQSPPPRQRPVERTQAPTPAPSATTSRAPAGTPSGWRVQLGAFSSEANARRHWNDVSRRVASLGSLQPFMIRAGNLTRLQAGPLANRGAAERLCTAIQARSGACFVVAP